MQVCFTSFIVNSFQTEYDRSSFKDNLREKEAKATLLDRHFSKEKPLRSKVSKNKWKKKKKNTKTC